MTRYRKISVRIWNDEKFRTLSDNAKLVFLFLLSHPHMTSLGAMRGTIPGLASELNWTTEAFREAFGEALSKGMAKHDVQASFVWLPKFLRHNGPESPNVVKSWANQVDLLPECSMKNELLQDVKAFVEGLSKGFQEALPEAFAKGMPNPEPKPYPKPEHEHEHEPTPVVPTKTNRTKRGSSKSGSGAGSKGFDPEDLKDPGKVQAYLERHGPEIGLQSSDFDTQVNVLACAIHARNEADNPGGMFVANFHAKRWKSATDNELADAKRIVSDQRRNEAVPNLLMMTALNKLGTVPPPDDIDAERQRQRQALAGFQSRASPFTAATS